MDGYTIEQHGDPLEILAEDFIKNKFPYYGEVWKIFIGHKGDGTKADMPGYSFTDLHDRFSEHSYTILESAYIMDDIIRSKTFENEIVTFHDYLEFNKSFIAFFAHLGRIKDNLERATIKLLCFMIVINRIVRTPEDQARAGPLQLFEPVYSPPYL